MTRPLHNRLAREWRAGNADTRAKVEAIIEAQGMSDMFAMRDGVLFARVTDTDRKRIACASGGGVDARGRRHNEEITGWLEREGSPVEMREAA
jgi:hypothetical protein